MLVFQNGDDVGCKREKRAAAAKAAIREKCINVNVKFTTPCPIFFIFLLGGKKKRKSKKNKQKNFGVLPSGKKVEEAIGFIFFVYVLSYSKEKKKRGSKRNDQ